jgi:hypothetical protein
VVGAGATAVRSGGVTVGPGCVMVGLGGAVSGQSRRVGAVGVSEGQCGNGRLAVVVG